MYITTENGQCNTFQDPSQPTIAKPQVQLGPTVKGICNKLPRAKRKAIDQKDGKSIASMGIFDGEG
jgi:hypothetical protein